MTETLTLGPRTARRTGETALAGAAQLWLGAALIGQWAFVGYILGFYGPSSLTGHFQAWSRNHNLFKGYVAGDTAGNLVFAAHVLVAAAVAFSGALQLIPQLRKAAPRFHRWNGRAFLVASIIASASGLYMVWVRGAVQNPASGLAISLDAVLILAFAALAWRSAVERRLDQHRRWAMRLYLAANGVWFFRAFAFAWAVLGRGAGMTDTGNGPMDYAIGFGCYLAPLAVFELYERSRRGGEAGRWTMAGSLVGLSLLTSFGIGCIAWIIWRPLLAL